MLIFLAPKHHLHTSVLTALIVIVCRYYSPAPPPTKSTTLWLLCSRDCFIHFSVFHTNAMVGAQQALMSRRKSGKGVAWDGSMVIYPFIQSLLYKNILSSYYVPDPIVPLVNTEMTISSEAFKDLRV